MMNKKGTGGPVAVGMSLDKVKMAHSVIPDAKVAEWAVVRALRMRRQAIAQWLDTTTNPRLRLPWTQLHRDVGFTVRIQSAGGRVTGMTRTVDDCIQVVLERNPNAPLGWDVLTFKLNTPAGIAARKELLMR